MSAVRSKLLTYIKLFNGGFQGTSDVDFAGSTLGRFVSYSNTEWTKAGPDIIICPLAMFKDPQTNICYREGMLTVVFAPFLPLIADMMRRAEASGITCQKWSSASPVNDDIQLLFVSYESAHAQKFLR